MNTMLRLFLLGGWIIGGTIACAEEPLPAKLAPYFQPPAEFANDLGSYRSPLVFADGTLVSNASEWSKRREELLKQWHGLMGPWPPLLEEPKVEVLEQERRENITQQHLRVQTATEKITEDCYLLIPDGEGPFPAAVVVFYDAKTSVGLGKSERDFAWQLCRRGFVTLSLGSSPTTYYPTKETCRIQPLSFHAYEAANCHTILAKMPKVDAKRIGVVGHSYGGKWAMFSAALYDKFACGCWSDPGIVFDESRSNINYWEPWYLGFEPGVERKPGIVTETNPRTGPYKTMIERKIDLQEIHALVAPRPFLVSGGAEDPPARWKALNHTVAVNRLLGYTQRVAMTNRPLHDPNKESNEVLCEFFQHFLRPSGKE